MQGKWHSILWPSHPCRYFKSQGHPALDCRGLLVSHLPMMHVGKEICKQAIGTKLAMSKELGTTPLPPPLLRMRNRAPRWQSGVSHGHAV